jgi:hypothetical protein
VPPRLLEPGWAPSRCSGPCAECSCGPSSAAGLSTIIGQLEPTGMPKHVRMDCEWPSRRSAEAADRNLTTRATQPTETGLAGWAYRIRTAESGRGLPDWICVTTWPEVGASSAAETFAFELHDTQLQLGPIFQRGFKRDADRIVTIIRIMRGASRSRICGPQATSCSRTMHRATHFSSCSMPRWTSSGRAGSART